MPALKYNALTRLLWRSHRWVYRTSKGRLMSKVGRHPVLELTTKGRKSGEPRSVLLTFVEDDGDYAVAGSYTGQDRHPAWWLNLMADPNGEITLRGKRTPIVASLAEGERRERLWSRFNEIDAAYQSYQDATDREIPVVLLSPAG